MGPGCELRVTPGILRSSNIFHSKGQYQLNFSNAQWIEPPQVAPVAYFRKEIFLSHTPVRAWLEIAATDDFELIINGHTIGRGNSLKRRVAGIYDIKKALKVGTNVIAASVSRTSFPGSAQVLVYGLLTKLDGASISVISDEKWRVTDNTGIVTGSEEWTSPKVQDEVWPNARRAFTTERRPGIDRVDTNPLLFQLPSVGSWIMAEDARSEIICSTTIQADAARQETWIQVASSGNLDLLVNGQLVTLANSSAVARSRLPHLATAQPTPTAGRSPCRAPTCWRSCSPASRTA